MHAAMSRRGDERGAVVVMMAFALVLLVAMLGMVLDIGHLYIVKTELQNAADACVLSAAQELSVIDGTVLSRATDAGRAAGAANRVDFQSKPVAIQDSDITFGSTLSGSFSRSIGGAENYVRCAPYSPQGLDIALWFSGVLGLVSGKPATSLAIGAEAFAKLGPRQSGGSPIATLAG